MKERSVTHGVLVVAACSSIAAKALRLGLRIVLNRRIVSAGC